MSWIPLDDAAVQQNEREEFENALGIIDSDEFSAPEYRQACETLSGFADRKIGLDIMAASNDPHLVRFAADNGYTVDEPKPEPVKTSFGPKTAGDVVEIKADSEQLQMKLADMPYTERLDTLVKVSEIVRNMSSQAESVMGTAEKVGALETTEAAKTAARLDKLSMLSDSVVNATQKMADELELG